MQLIDKPLTFAIYEAILRGGQRTLSLPWSAIYLITWYKFYTEANLDDEKKRH